MSSALYIFRLVWPFLKELVLGSLSLKEGMRTQKKKVFLLFFVSGLIISIFLIIPKFYILYQEHAKLEKSVDANNVKRLQDRIKELEERSANPPKPTPEVAKADKPESNNKPEPDAILVESPTAPKSSIPRQRVKKQKPQRPAANDTEVKKDRKKAYMDFFDKYED